MTKQANLRETVSVAEVATVCGFRSDGGIPSRGSLLVCDHYQFLRREVLQLPRAAARSSQDSVLMSRALMSLLQTSLNLWCGRPILLCPVPSFPQRMSFGMRPSSMRRRERGLTYTADVVSEGCTLWEGQHETGLQRWSPCLARICPRCGVCLLGVRC